MNMKNLVKIIVLAAFFTACKESDPALLDHSHHHHHHHIDESHQTWAPPENASIQGVGGAHTIEVVVHNLMNGQPGSGYSNQQITDMMDQLNLNFSPHCISFNYSVQDLVNPTWYYEEDHQEWFTNILPTFNDNSRIDVLLFPALNNLGRPGVAGGIPGTRLAIGGLFQGQVVINSNVLTHEMGHSLGLTNHATQCGNFMYVGTDLSCLQYFDASQEAIMLNTLTNSPILANVFQTDPLGCCYDTHWNLTGLPGSNVPNTHTVNYVIQSSSSPVNVKPNYPSIRVSTKKKPINVTYKGQSYGVQLEGFRDIPIEGIKQCTENPSISAPLKFHTLDAPFGGSLDPEVTVQLQYVTPGHTRSSGKHTFILGGGIF